MVWNAFMVFCVCVSVFNFFYQMFRWDAHYWFKTGAMVNESVSTWSETDIDENLHKLSRWNEFNATQWVDFVSRSYRPFDIEANSSFCFLEVGVGVGAWARVFLNKFPGAIGDGLDVEPEALAVAASVLSTNRITLQLNNMINIPQIYENRDFDYVFIPGTLCYADSLNQIYVLLRDIVEYNVIKKGGKLSATMLASDVSQTGSCTTRIPKVFWYSLKQYNIVEFQQMDDWQLPHSFGRYAVYLQVKS